MLQFDLSDEVHLNLSVYFNKVRGAMPEEDITKRAVLSALIATAMKIIPPEDCAPLALEHARQRGFPPATQKTRAEVEREGYELYRKLVSKPVKKL